MTNEPTRERLERALGVLKLHHKMLVNEIDGMTHDINESIDAFAVGIALAAVEYLKQIKEAQNDQNAELERQSVTDEDVAEAIEFLEIINHPQFALWDKKQRKALSLATEALQAYRPEREPCNWCREYADKGWDYRFCPKCGRRLED